jgi:hypothetical protein
VTGPRSCAPVWLAWSRYARFVRAACNPWPDNFQKHGAGRAFCAGADLLSGGATFDRQANPGDPSRESLKVGDVYRDGGGTNTLRIYPSPKPVIGAINGPAVGIGATAADGISDWPRPKHASVSCSRTWHHAGGGFLLVMGSSCHLQQALPRGC